MRFLNNIEVGVSPAFSLPLTDGSSGQVLKTNGTGTVTWGNDNNTDTNYYVDAATFNTSNGELTIGVNGASNVVVDLDGRYLTSYTDTNTTYSVSVPSSTTSIRLTGTDASTDDIAFVGAGATTITRTNASTITITSTDTNTNTTYTAGTGLALTGTVFSNTITNNNQLTNGAGYTTNTGTTTASNTQTFTNKSGAISQWTNDAGYLTSAGDITGVIAGTGLSGGGTTGTVTLTNAAPNVSTNLTTTTAATTLTVNSSDGTNAILPAATTTVAGVMTGADKSKLDGIAAGATNVTNNNQLTNGAGYITSYVNTTYTAGSGITLTGTVFSNAAPNIVQTTVSGNAGSATVLQTARTIAGVSFNGSANISLNNNAITNGAGYITSYVNTTYTAGSGITLTGTVFSNAAPNIVQTTVSGNAGSATVLQTARTIAGVSFNGSANISLNNNAITNGAGYITSYVNTTYTAGTGLALTGTVFSNTITNNNQLTNGAGYITSYVNTTYTAGTGLALTGTVFSNTITNNNQLTNGAGYTTNTGTTTASNTQTFTNKSGNISQWTNDAGYLTSAGDITGVIAGTGLSGGGTTGTVTLTNAAPNVSTNLTTTTAATTVTVNSSDGTNAILPAATTTVAGVMTGADKSKLNGIAAGATNVTNNNQLTNGAGYTTNVGDITGVTAGAGISGGGTSGTVTITNSDKGSSQDIFKHLDFDGVIFDATNNDDTATFKAGTNVSFSADAATKIVTISATNTNTTYSAGSGITLTGTVFSNAAPNVVQTTITGNAGSATVLQTPRTIAGVSFNGSANISLNNNAITNGAGYTTNAGDITSVGVGNGLTGGGTSGAVTVSMSGSYTGNFTATQNITAYSDERLKTNIETIPNALEKVNSLRGVTFDKDGVRGLGVIAQEVEKILPEVVIEGEEYKSVAYGNIVGVLIEAIKELTNEVEELKRKLN